MKKLHKLLLSSYIGPFLVTLFVVLFFLVMQFLWKYMDDMIGKGLELHLVFKLLFFASANLVPMALPLAVLLASIMTFGNLAEHYELVSIKSAGISLFRTMFPLILFSVFVSLSSFVFMNYVWPVANLKMKTLLYDITHKKPALDIIEKVYYKEIDGYVIRVERKSKDQQTLYGVSIYDHSQHKGNNKIIRADSGRMVISEDEKSMYFELYNGASYEEQDNDNDQKNNFPLARTNFKKEKVLFDLSSFEMKETDEEIFKDNYEMLSLRQLEAQIDSTELRSQKSFDKFNRFVTNQTYLFKDTLATNTIHQDSLISTTELISTLAPKQKTKLYQNTLKMLRNAKSYNTSAINNTKQQKKRIERYKIEWHRKFAIPFMSLILFFVGAPLGAITRKGGIGLPVLISIVFFIFYYVIGITGEKLVKQGELFAHQGMWLAPIILTPLAIFLTVKAANDSRILKFK